MTDLLDLDDEVTTVSGHDRWASLLDVYADETPVSRPVGSVRAYNMLASLYRHRSAYTHLRAVQPVPLESQMYIIAIDGTLASLTLGGGTALGPSQGQIVTAVAEPPADPAEHPGTAALRDLENWLGMGLDAVVQLAGLAPSTRAFWRANPAAPIRPSKAGRLLRLHSAVGLLVGERGLEHAQAMLRGGGWLAEPLDEGRLARLEVLVRQVLVPEGLRPPTYMTDGGLTPEELRARVLSDPEDETVQRVGESAAATIRPGRDAPGET